jgi:rod shape determining protein RodA
MLNDFLLKIKEPLETFSLVLPISIAGLFTMNSFVGTISFFDKQIIWLLASAIIFFIFSFIDWRFLRRTDVVVTLFFLNCAVLLFLFFLGKVVNGSKSWFNFGGFSFQPADISKPILILVLAKYFSRRHILIRHLRHIIVSGVYAFIIFLLVFLQPDFGSAMVIFFIWLGMVIVSGLSKTHLAVLLFLGLIIFAFLWNFSFASYQKDRIKTFISPMSDIRGAGYNAFQSVIAIGSGSVLGKGIGYGTQSRLNFLPEYQTDFIFAAFAEEWGMIGAIILLALYSILIVRIVKQSYLGATNFEIFFGLGIAIYFMCHIFINIGMNLGLMPITGLTLPFMSYGGSHLLAEFSALGLLSGMNRYGRAVYKDVSKNEVVGL